MINEYNSLLGLSSKRKSIRRYSPNPLPEVIVDKIVAIAATSPYAGGRKNWGVKKISDRAVIEEMVEVVEDKIEQLANSLENTEAQLFKNYGKNFLIFKEASHLLIPYFRVSPTIRSLLREGATPPLLEWERDNATKSISCVAMLLLLAAESLEVGACYMTGPLIAERELAELLEIPPGREIGAIIPIGYPL